jgi:hypothetical protein
MPALLVSGMSTAATFIEQLFDSRNKSKKKGKASNKANASSKVKTKPLAVLVSKVEKKKVQAKPLGKYTDKDFVEVLTENYKLPKKTIKEILLVYNNIKKNNPNASKTQLLHFWSLLLSKISYGTEGNSVPVSGMWNQSSGWLFNTFGENDLDGILKRYGIKNPKSLKTELLKQHLNDSDAPDFEHFIATISVFGNNSPTFASLYTSMKGVEIGDAAGAIGDTTTIGGDSISLSNADYQSDLDADNIRNRIKAHPNVDPIQIITSYYAGVTNKTINRATEYMKHHSLGELADQIKNNGGFNKGQTAGWDFIHSLQEESPILVVKK